ncbi:hypothetical protein OIV83_005288 [Microbotryomycetes sp. JL201]|nr:hypothetical protein OIV83_005288 [Microbotryomycetes sp. JL201]
MARHRRSRSRQSSESSHSDDSDDHALLTDEESGTEHHRSASTNNARDEEDRRRRNSYIGWGAAAVVLVIIVGVLIWLGMTGKLSLGGGASTGPQETAAPASVTQSISSSSTSVIATGEDLTDVTGTSETSSPTATEKTLLIGTTDAKDKIVFTGDTAPAPTTEAGDKGPAGQLLEGLTKWQDGKTATTKEAKPTPTVSVNWDLYKNVPSTLPKEAPKDVQKLQVNFKDMTNDDSLVSFLEKKGLTLVDKTRFDSDPLDYEYNAKQAKVVDDSLQLTVKKGEENGVTYGAQIATTEKKIQYGLITTRVKLTAVPGIRQVIQFSFDKLDAIELGMPSSFYGSTQGIRGVTPGLQLQVVQGETTRRTFTYVRSVEEDWHDLSIMWTPHYVVMFVNGEAFGTSQIDEDVPKRSASIKWGAFSNGNEKYSLGPPEEDATFTIASIDGWFLTES